MLVNREFQSRYIRYAAFIGVMSTVFTGFIILFPLYTFEILRIPQFLPKPFLIGMIIAAFLNIVIIAMLTLFVTHRIAGPLYALVRNFRFIERGNWNAILHLRKDDDLRYVARNYNSMIESLISQAKSDLSLCQQLESRFDAILNINEDEEKKLKSILNELKTNINKRLQEPNSIGTTH